MPRIKITVEKTKEIFGKYDDCQEEPIECGIRLRKFLSELLKTWSVPKNRVDKTMRILEILKQNINEAKRSQEASTLDPASIIMADKRKNDEQSLRLTITKTKELLDSLIENQKLENLTLKYTILGSTLSAVTGISAIYALSMLLDPLKWSIGYYTLPIGIVFTLIATAYVWKALRYNSSPTQVAVAVIVTPLFAIIASICIIVVSGALISTVLMATNESNTINLLQIPNVNLEPSHIMQQMSEESMVAVGLLISIPVGLLLAVLIANIERKLIGIKALKPATNQETDESDEDS